MQITFYPTKVTQPTSDTKNTCKQLDYARTLCTTRNGPNILIKLP